jgi:integrase
LITRNPTRGIEFPAQQLLAPREFSTSQRFILKELVEAEDLRGQAMFALGYYAGCRASDVCWFRLDQVHSLTKKSGCITVGYKRGQLRTIDLANEARKPLRAYIEEERRRVQTDCPFVFLSQRSRETTGRAGDHPKRFTEGGLHAWWRTLKERATRQQWEQIADITFHDLRHDFGHRLRNSDFTLEEVAVSLGHVTKKGTPAVGTTARYTQPNREQMRNKLKNIHL